MNNPLLDTGIPVQGMVPCWEGSIDEPFEKRVGGGMVFGMEVVHVTGDFDGPIVVESHVGRQWLAVVEKAEPTLIFVLFCGRP